MRAHARTYEHTVLSVGVHTSTDVPYSYSRSTYLVRKAQVHTYIPSTVIIRATVWYSAAQYCTLLTVLKKYTSLQYCQCAEQQAAQDRRRQEQAILYS